jgi:hypothetical protein
LPEYSYFYPVQTPKKLPGVDFIDMTGYPDVIGRVTLDKNEALK